ncbi:MAG: carotenoid biosynthesis protein, partial [Bacteroidales bacterium]|nr:carotenoid biosynthesis protein [Bacteroidales bacterium]
MEPVAMHLDYWQWEGDIIPFQNYAAWFIISLVFSYALAIFRIRTDSWLLRWYFIIQLGFFLLFRLEMMI